MRRAHFPTMRNASPFILGAFCLILLLVNAVPASEADGRAEQVALQEANIELSFEMTHLLYEGEKLQGAPPAVLQELRDEMSAQRASIRGAYASRVGRLWVSDILEQTFGELLRDELLHRPRPEVIFREMESLKAQLLLDQLQRPYSPLSSRNGAERAESIEQSLLNYGDCKYSYTDLLARELQLISRVPIGALYPNDGQTQGVQELERIYAAEKAGFKGTAKIPRLDELRAALTADEAFVEFFIPHSPSHPARDLAVLVATRQRVSLQTISLDEVLGTSLGYTGRTSVGNCPPLDISALGDAVAMLRNYIQRSDEKNAHRMLREFHRLLIEPIILAGFSPASYKRLIIVPHGPLHYLPFAALVDAKDRFLIQDTAITMSPSGAVWYAMQQKPLKQPGTVVGVLALPESQAEMEALRTAFPGPRTHILEGGLGAKKALRDLVSVTNVLHVSAHGEFPGINPLDYHKILLSPAASRDGGLNAREVRDLDLSATGVVVLAICNGGLYRFGPSDEPYGLVPAFLAGGASNVIGTLWPLDDTFGRQFAARIYNRLVNEGPAKALQQAALIAIRDEELIRNWAAFALVGAGRPYR